MRPVYIATLLAFGIAAPLAFTATPLEAQIRQQRILEVDFSHAELRPFYDPIEALGSARANETVTITPRVSDTVAEILFEEGQQVSKGDILIKLDTAEETASLRAAQALLTERESAYNRAKSLQAKEALSSAILLERESLLKQIRADIQAIQARINDRVIRAPFDGIVGLRNVSVGTLVQPGQSITTIDDLGTIKVDFAVPSIHLGLLQTGLAFEAKSDAFPNTVFEGTVATINSQVDPATRTVTVRGIVPNPQLSLRPGLLMRIVLKSNPREALLIEEGALLRRGHESFVYVPVESEGKIIAQRRVVKTAGRQPGFVEITEGLEVGERIIYEGLVNISEGSELKEKAKTQDSE